MIYTPNYISNADGQGAAIGAVAGSIIPGIGTAVGGAIGGIVDVAQSVFGAKKSAWSNASSEEKRKLIETLVYKAMFIDKVSLWDADKTKIYKYIYDTLNSTGQFEGRPVDFNAFLRANMWIHDVIFAAHGLKYPNGATPVDLALFNQVRDYITKGTGNPPTPNQYVIVDNSQPQTQMDYSKAPAKPGDKKSGTKTEEEKKAANKKILFYGGIGLVVVILIIVLIFVFKKKGRK
jgi:hypothetical protein